MLLADLVTVSEAVSATSARSEKTALLARALSAVPPEEVRVAVSYLSGRPTQPRLNTGYATVFAVDSEPSANPTLELSEVDDRLEELASVSGPGSKARRQELLTGLFSRATIEEQAFLRGLILRNLRQGALEGVMADAVAAAIGTTPERVRRAAMLEGDLRDVAVRALVVGEDALASSSLTVFTAVQPMLAKTSESASSAVTSLGEAVVERKLDGLRLQVHRHGEEVKVFTRNLRDITGEVPGVVGVALSLSGSSFILDGEGLMIDEEGSPLSFQDSMSRAQSGPGPLTAFYFDILSLNGRDLIDHPLRERRAALEALVPEQARVTAVITDDPDEAERFFESAVADGFEGVVVKDPSQPYEAGRRGSGWLKVKPTHTLDLLVLAAEWGSGRRRGWLSNLHLGALGADGGHVMLGKTFKGLTDEMLEWQTRAFLAAEDHRDGHVVYLKPSFVYEIAFDGVQRSSRYPGGVALRFARVKGHRDDKSPDEVDTLSTVRSFLR